MKRMLATMLVACACAFAPLQAPAVELPRVFGEGMVLQREQPIPVWGRSPAGARVTVEFDGRVTRTRADRNGDWRVEPGHGRRRAACAAHRRRQRAARAGRRFRRRCLAGVRPVQHGGPMAQSADAEAGIATATDPLIRHFKIPKSWAGEPQWQLAGGDWVASRRRSPAASPPSRITWRANCARAPACRSASSTAPGAAAASRHGWMP